jgi:hypothetical protein
VLPFADNLQPSSGNYSEMVADERAPPHLYLALELFPISSRDVTIHINPLYVVIKVFDRNSLLVVL